jgi:hypothetical protein
MTCQTVIAASTATTSLEHAPPWLRVASPRALIESLEAELGVR